MSRRERREREEREAKEQKIREKEEKRLQKILKKRDKELEKKAMQKQKNASSSKKSKKNNNKKKNNTNNSNSKYKNSKQKTSAVQNKKSKKNKKPFFLVRFLMVLLKILLIFVLIACLLAGSLIAYLGVKTNWQPKEMLKLATKKTTMMITGQSEEDIKNLKPIYCLVMGVSKDIDRDLTDTIMLCAYYPRTQQASILSIPRDTFIGNNESLAHGKDKINAVYANHKNSPKATLKEVEELTGLDINNYVVVNTKVLVKIIDKIGGVKFDVPIDMKYDSKKQDLHINLKKGEQLIDGKKAEQLLRFRHNNDGTSYPYKYGDNDFGRMKTQRNFIIATAKQTLQLKNVSKIRDLIKIVLDNVDTNLDINEVLKYVPAAIDFNIDNIKSTTLPGVADRIGPSNLWFFVHDEDETEEIIDEMFLFNEKEEKKAEASID